MLRRYFVRLNDLILRLGRGRIYVFVFALLIFIGMLDFWVGYEISLNFFYLIPLAIATWYLGKRAGYLTALFGILIWDIANRASGMSLSNELIRYWNMGIRLASYFVFVLLLNELRSAIQHERALARIDHLTGVFNRLEFMECLGSEIPRANRMRYPVSLAYIDLDNFKKVNDEQGHAMGDRHLRLIAETISSNIRKTDLFARLGGDEFALFLPNVDQVSTRVVLEKVESAVMRALREIQSPVTMSIGVTTFNSPPASVDDMIRKADAAMYQAKIMGKRQIIYLEMN